MDTRVKSIFGPYAEQLQVLVDTNIERFKEPLFPRYFSFATPSTGLTYAGVIGRARLEAAASVVAHGSEAPLRSRAGLERYYGEVAAIKVKRKMDEQEYRNWLTLDAMSVSDEAKKTQILQLIWDDVKYVVDSVQSRIDYMVGQALSEGKITIDKDTNPDGIAPGEVDMLVKGKWGTNTAFDTGNDNERWLAANSATAKPITDIQYITRKAWNDYGIQIGKMLMSPEKLWILLDNPQVQAHLKGSVGLVTGQDALYSLGNLNAYLAAQQLPIIELVDFRVSIEKDGVLTRVNPWKDKKYVAFVPDGQLGVIHNSLAIEEISPVTGVDYALAQRTLVSKWAQTEPFGEFTRGELTAFPGLEAADQIIIVNTEHRTTF